MANPASPRLSVSVAAQAVVQVVDEKKGLSAIIRLYLVVYNILCILGWGYIDYLLINHFFHGGDLSGVWPIVELPLKIVQTAVALEIFHAVLGWVRSGASTAFVQGVSFIVCVTS